MNYEKALERWGAIRLSESAKGDWQPESISPDEFTMVTVATHFDEGYECCGGTDPDCYCSLAESPSAEVVISGLAKGHEWRDTIDLENFDFVTFLQEIVEAGLQADA